MTPAIFELTLPFPPQSQSPNARVNFHVKARDAATYKNECYVLARTERQRLQNEGADFPLTVPVTVLLTFLLPARTRRDWDNLHASFKAGFDGIVEAGVLHDDNVWELRMGLEVELGKKAGVRVRLVGGDE